MARRRRRIYASDRLAAVRQDTDIESVGRMAQSTILTLTRKLERDIVRAFRAGESVQAAIRDGMLEVAEVMTKLSTVSALKGYERSAKAARPQVEKKAREQAETLALQTRTEILDRALRFLRNRLLLPEETIAQIGATFAEEVLRVVRNVTADVSRAMQIAVAEITAQGLHVRAGVDALRKAWQAAGLSSSNPYLLETAFRTQTQLAYSAGARAFEQDPDIQEILWGYKYITAGDARVRAEHAAMDGTTLPKEDPWWNANMPPNGFNCRCQAIPIYEERVVVEPPTSTRDENGNIVPVVADEGFRFNVGNLPL